MVDGLSIDAAIVLNSAHAVLAESIARVCNATVANIIKALSSVLRYIARCIQAELPFPNSPGQVVVLDMHHLLTTVSAPKFKENPDILDDVPPSTKSAHLAFNAEVDALPRVVEGAYEASVQSRKLQNTSLSRESRIEDPAASLSALVADVKKLITTDPDADKSKSPSKSISKTPPRYPLAESAPPSRIEKDVIHVVSCRSCSNQFKYQLQGEGIATVICGIPEQVEYRAVSYVWGEVSQVPVRCEKCSASTSIPFGSLSKFDHLMRLAGTDTPIWLDAMSIDQKNPQELAAQVAIMGDIYGNAQTVLVCLPTSDIEAFSLLQQIIAAALDTVTKPWLFGQHAGGEQEENMSGSCQAFYHNISILNQRLHEWLYWRRAWTFQEWALARDLEVGYEGLSSKLKLKHIKAIVLQAALSMASYKLHAGQYGSVDLGFSRGEVPARLAMIKRLFPREDFFTSNENVDHEKHLYQTVFPHFELDQVLSLQDKPIPNQAEKLRNRLGLMLDAYGTSKREAWFEADLICCWASMCNIEYDYNKNDNRAIALQKVLSALRKRGIKIYNFLVNTEARTEVDLEFVEYARVHPICNSTNQGLLTRPPIFSGQTDTVFHLQKAVLQSRNLAPLYYTQKAGKLEFVEANKHVQVVHLTDSEAVVDHFSKSLLGQHFDTSGLAFTHILEHMLELLNGIPRAQLDKHVLVFVKVKVTSLIPWARGPPGSRELIAWAVCPSTVNSMALKVARETMNGSLVVARSTSDSIFGSAALETVAYLTITHHQCGTYLLNADDKGVIQITFHQPIRSDVMITRNEGFLDRMCVRVTFEDERPQ